MNTMLRCTIVAALLACLSALGFAGITLKINGNSSGTAIAQGDTLQWTISGLSSGATVKNKLWFDADSDGVINVSTDILIVSFAETDGVSGDPGDQDGSANGIIYTNAGNIGFPAGHYIFTSKCGTDSVAAAFSVTAMTSPTYTISGKVTKSGSAAGNLFVQAVDLNHTKEFYGMTNSSGNYTLATNVAANTVMRVRVWESMIPSGYVSTPNEDTVTLSSNLTGINFSLSSGKIITGYVKDSSGNAIANININAQPVTGGNGYDAETDANGQYFLAVDTGKYIIQFGEQQNTYGYLLTYYNQQHVNMYADTIVMNSTIDTVKNINAVLYKAAIIMGTMTENGTSVAGGIAAFAYANYSNPGNSGNQLYQSWHDSDYKYYYLAVLPGTYTIVFTENSNSSNVVYYNQTYAYPGTSVTVSAVGDTVKNINVDFGTVTAVAANQTTPKSFALQQNYPNPFNPTTQIAYQVPNAAMVSIKVFDLLGREVATLVNEVKTAGSYTAVFNASKCASGVYFYQLKAGNFVQTKKMSLLK